MDATHCTLDVNDSPSPPPYDSGDVTGDQLYQLTQRSISDQTALKKTIAHKLALQTMEKAAKDGKDEACITTHELIKTELQYFNWYELLKIEGVLIQLAVANGTHTSPDAAYTSVYLYWGPERKEKREAKLKELNKNGKEYEKNKVYKQVAITAAWGIWLVVCGGMIVYRIWIG